MPKIGNHSTVSVPTGRRFRPDGRNGMTNRNMFPSQTETCFQANKNGTLPDSLKLTFSQLKNECLEDYILSFLDHLFRCDADIAIPLPHPAGASPLDIPFPSGENISPEPKIVFPCWQRVEDFLFTQGKIEGL